MSDGNLRLSLDLGPPFTKRERARGEHADSLQRLGRKDAADDTNLYVEDLVALVTYAIPITAAPAARTAAGPVHLAEEHK